MKVKEYYNFEVTKKYKVSIKSIDSECEKRAKYAYKMFKRKCEEIDIDSYEKVVEVTDHRGNLHVQIHSFLRKEKVQKMKDMFDEIWKTFSDGKVEVHEWEYIYQEPRDPFPHEE